MSHFATYDVLSLSLKLQERLGDVSIEEVQMFAYLSCLLSIYDSGKGIDDWGYLFIKNKIGAPYSNEISDSGKELISNGSFNLEESNYYVANHNATRKFALLSSIGSYVQREKYLEASTKCIKFIPYGDVRSALQKEPTLILAKKTSARQILLNKESASIHLLYNQFENLRKALDGKYKNLVIPALVWMSHNSNLQFG